MQYRIQKDDVEPPLYWIEKLSGKEWVRVFGTMQFSAGESWAALQNRESIITQEEIAMLLSEGEGL